MTGGQGAAGSSPVTPTIKIIPSAWRRGIGMWLSLVEHYVRDVGAAGSNPVIPTTSHRAAFLRILCNSKGFFFYPHGAPFSSKIVAALRLLACKRAHDGSLSLWASCELAPAAVARSAMRSSTPIMRRGEPCSPVSLPLSTAFVRKRTRLQHAKRVVHLRGRGTAKRWMR